jgi:hypothetical protein
MGSGHFLVEAVDYLSDRLSGSHVQRYEIAETAKQGEPEYLKTDEARLQARVNLSVDEAAVAAALPGVAWLIDAARTFLLSAEYDLRTRPPQLDFATVVLAYAKAVEQMLGARLFARFRDESGATAADCKSESLGKFMAGAKPPTLSVMSDILRSPKEAALRAFADRAFVNAAETIFGDAGVAGLLTDKAAIELRNRAAHDTVLTRADALQARAWALGILRLL